MLSVLEEQIQSEKPITLKTRISSIIPDDFVLADEYATAHATLEDALCHRLGLGPSNLNYGGEKFEDYTLRDAIRSLRHLAMTEELRAKFQYLNLGYMVVQYVVENLTGKWIGDVHRERIWGPLGMDSTFIRPGDALKAGKQLAYSYSWEPFHQKQLHQPWTDTPLVGGGGIITSATDFAKYLRAVLDHKLPLSESSQKDLHTPRIISSPPTTKHMTHVLYALGWGVTSYRDNEAVQHAGEYLGCASTVKLLPNKRWGVAILANADDNGSNICDALARRLIDDRLGVPLDEREDRVPVLDQEDLEKMFFYQNARSALYPSIPDPPLPTTLPLSEYAGTYHHPAYQTMVFYLETPRPLVPVAKRTSHVLHANIHRVLSIMLDLEHVSGDHFVVWTDLEQTTPIARTAFRAQFKIGSDGKVGKLGVDWNVGPMPASDESPMMAWFDKI